MLNFYPVEILGRALDSICRQQWSGTWTLYIGFHNRDGAHKESIRRRCIGQPVHFVDIAREMVMDVRPRNVVLQEALRLGKHKWLFFLDDDDEWYPHYLSRMTEAGSPFVTCGKDVLAEETGKTDTRLQDVDYSGMGFRFADWQGHSLPYYIKQVSDKHICRTFKSIYPHAPHIQEPLYLIHQHRDSLTFWGSLGRNQYKDKILSGICRVVYDGDNGAEATAKDCSALAKTLNGRVIPAAESMRGEGTRTCYYIVSPESLSYIVQSYSEAAVTSFFQDSVVLLLAEEAPAFFFKRPADQQACFRRADGLLLADPLWIEAYEHVNPRCLPVGIPSLLTEEAVLVHLRNRPNKRRLYIDGDTEFSREVTRRLPADIECTGSLAEADLCWLPPKADRSWGRTLLEAFEQGVPCISPSEKTAAKILFDGTGLLCDSTDPAEIARLITGQMGNLHAIESGIPFFRRCFGSFYWINSFTAYMLKLMKHKAFDRLGEDG